MDFEKDPTPVPSEVPSPPGGSVEGPALSTVEGTDPAGMVIGLRHLLVVAALFAAAVFVAGFGWWTLSGTADFSELRATLLAEPGQESPVAGPAARLVPTVSSARQPVPRAEPRQMALPPVRKGFKPQPEATSVKGDPDAPITIVEYSDYQ